jgi:hypothetical protein
MAPGAATFLLLLLLLLPNVTVLSACYGVKSKLAK